VIIMPTPRCCRHQSVTRTPLSTSIPTVDVVSGDPRLGIPDLWHRPDGRVEVRAGARLTPAALVQLAAACYALWQAGRQPVLRVDEAAVRRDLWRCGFVQVVHPVTTLEPPLVIAPGADQEPQTSPLLLNVTRLATSADLPALLERIIEILRQRLHYRPDDACDVATAVSELCQNTFDHNAHAGAFLAMQVASWADPRCLEIAIADDGAGLAATLRRNPHHAPLASDLEAIQVAVQRGTSAYDDPTRGTGLYHLLALIAKQAGVVQIRSGTATVRYQRDQPQAWASAVPWRPGVHVTLTLPTPGG
jgi:anti-sigma regulatory factor (Ser/Thr protein kinase)